MKRPMKEPPSKEKPDTGENKPLEDEPKKKGRRKIMASMESEDESDYLERVHYHKGPRKSDKNK
jgi:hypothetical protein